MSDDDIATYRANYDRAAWERITQGWRLHVVPSGAVLAINALCDEVERLREDAERYRWLRNNPEWLGWDSDFQPDEVEREIDEARGVK